MLHRGDQCFPFFEDEDNQRKFEPGLDYAKKQLGYGRSDVDMVQTKKEDEGPIEANSTKHSDRSNARKE